MNPQKFSSKVSAVKKAGPDNIWSYDSVIEFFVIEFQSNSNKIWNSIEIYDVYIEYGGQQYLLSYESRLMNRISKLIDE